MEAIERSEHEARSLASLGYLGIADAEWLPQVALMDDAVILSRDLNLVRKRGEKQVIIDNRIGVILLTGGQSYADKIMELVLGNLSRIE